MFYTLIKKGLGRKMLEKNNHKYIVYAHGL